MKNEQIVKEFLGEIEHFVDQGGWPIKIDKKKGHRICRAIPALCIDEDGRLARDTTHDFDDGLIAALYKFRYEEIREQYDNLYSRVKKITEEF